MLPSLSSHWRELTKKHGLQSTTLDSIEASSGSKIQTDQFLLLRVLCSAEGAQHLIKRCRKSDKGENFLAEKTWHGSEKYLSESVSWNLYLRSFDSSTLPEGTFALVRYYQQLTNKSSRETPSELPPKVQFSPRPQRKTDNKYATARLLESTPTPGSRFRVASLLETPESSLVADIDAMDITSGTGQSWVPNIPSPWSPLSGDVAKFYKTVEDEQIVNTALVLFLNALTMHHTDCHAEWTLYRSPFVVKDSHGQKFYEARVDGLLRKRSHDPAVQVQAIIEVKPFLRYTNDDNYQAIRMQEAAQMAAWISQHPPHGYHTAGSGNYRRLLISQNRNEIYVTIASFDAKYVQYIRNEINTTRSFLRMSEYGPFNVSSKSNMQSLGVMMLAFSVQGGVQ